MAMLLKFKQFVDEFAITTHSDIHSRTIVYPFYILILKLFGFQHYRHSHAYEYMYKCV
jgi:hypothetical protein